MNWLLGWFDRRLNALQSDLRAVRRESASLRKDVQALREIEAGLRRHSSDATSELAEARNEIERLKAAMRVAQFENKQLWKLNARNVNRIEAEDAQYVRARAEAETGRVRATIDEERPDLDD